MALNEFDYVDPVVEAIALGVEFQREVNEKLQELGGDCTSPDWFEYCRQMDEWNAAVAADAADGTG